MCSHRRTDSVLAQRARDVVVRAAFLEQEKQVVGVAFELLPV